ncbi:hypothetical protein B0H34DRAFT_273045 [Crassisporium funariophilum]|nr:hypothetical protein B0H34DRAFT_273045 [Crassisporium funariophilum]
MLSLSGLLRNRVPFCMGAGGFVEVGLSVSGQRKRVGKSRAAEVQRVIYQPGYSNKWTSLDADTPIPSRSDQDAAQDIALTLAVGIPFGSSSSSRPTSERSTNVVGVQYIRVYRTRTSLTAEEAVGVWDCASGVVEENVVLDVLQCEPCFLSFVRIRRWADKSIDSLSTGS